MFFLVFNSNKRSVTIDLKNPDGRALFLKTVHLSASEAPTSPPPLAGQHTAEVLGEVLGISTDEVEKLRAQGVLG